MAAWRLAATGQLPQRQSIPVPVPSMGEVLVKVRACGMNFADTLVVHGGYQDRQPLPMTPGMELSGEIVAVGPSTKAPPLGTRVAAYVGHGALAQYARVKVARMVTIPDALNDIRAAAWPVVWGTAQVGLVHLARLAAGETLLVLGAGGGAGLAAVGLGRVLGARVIACARGADKLSAALNAGANHLIDSDSDDLTGQIKALGGADVVFDPVGGMQFDAALRASNRGARLLPLGFASGVVPAIAANIIMVKNISVLGLNWGGYATLNPHVFRASLEQVVGLIDEGRIEVQVGHTLGFDNALRAYEILMGRKAVGKVVVTLPA